MYANPTERTSMVMTVVEEKRLKAAPIFCRLFPKGEVVKRKVDEFDRRRGVIAQSGCN